MIKKLALIALATVAVVPTVEAWFFYEPCFELCYQPVVRRQIYYQPVVRRVVYERPVRVSHPCSRGTSRDAAIGFGIASIFCGAAACAFASAR